MILVGSQTACPFSGHITIQNVLKGGDALVDFAVKKERITPEQGATIKVDFHDSIACAETLTDSLKAIAKGDPQAKQKKFNAWSTANQCWKPIVLRQNFAKDPQILKVSKLIDAIFAAGVIFYSPSPERPGVMAAPKDEKVLEDDLDRRLKELKEAMKTG